MNIVGVGAIGRQVAIQLAALGVPQIQIVDFDKVESHNITTQAYREKDEGIPKVDCCADSMWELDHTLKIERSDAMYGPNLLLGNVTFCCVDRISTRAEIWKQEKDNCDLWIDARMLGEVMRVLTAFDPASKAAYEKTLFAQSDAQTGTCTNRGTIYAAAVAAGLMVHQFTRWLRDMPPDPNLLLSLLTSEMSLDCE